MVTISPYLKLRQPMFTDNWCQIFTLRMEASQASIRKSPTTIMEFRHNININNALKGNLFIYSKRSRVLYKYRNNIAIDFKLLFIFLFHRSCASKLI